jgi:hypothetical protein
MMRMSEMMEGMGMPGREAGIGMRGMDMMNEMMKECPMIKECPMMKRMMEEHKAETTTSGEGK